MRVLIVAAALVALSGCATAASEEQKNQAIAAQVACFAVRSGSLDDGRSDAHTIGRAVAAACTTETGRVAALMSQGANNWRVDQEVLERISARSIDEATEMVLIGRQPKQQR